MLKKVQKECIQTESCRAVLAHRWQLLKRELIKTGGSCNSWKLCAQKAVIKSQRKTVMCEHKRRASSQSVYVFLTLFSHFK